MCMLSYGNLVSILIMNYKYCLLLYLTFYILALILCMFLYRLHSLFEIDENVTVLAVKLNDLWTVNNENGFVTRHTDTLVSGTTIVGSLFCSRRSVIADIYKGLDCNAANMVIGTLLHQLLQTVYYNWFLLYLL